MERMPERLRGFGRFRYPTGTWIFYVIPVVLAGIIATSLHAFFRGGARGWLQLGIFTGLLLWLWTWAWWRAHRR